MLLLTRGVVMRNYTWAPARTKTGTKITDTLKHEVESKADSLIDKVLKPKYIEPPDDNSTLNYVVDIFSKWHGRFFYFTSKYKCPGPNAISPFFDNNFARLEFIGNSRFNLAYMRHTGQWNEVGFDLSLKECFDAIENWPHFMP